MTACRFETMRFRSALIAMLTAILFAAITPEVPAQAPEQVLRALDTNQDGVIDETEAPAEMKRNFGFIDANGDGGIDREELEFVLSMMKNREGDGEGAAEGPRLGNQPGYGEQNPDAASFMNLPPEQDKMFYMLNLMKYREKAVYADGRETGLTGRQAAARYQPLPEVRKVGGGIVYAGMVEQQLVGTDPTWDMVGIVMYPSRAKLFQMASSEAFQKTVVHKDASLEFSQIMVTIPEESWDLPGESSSGSAEGSSSSGNRPFTLFHLVKYRDVAQYPEDSNEPERSGRDAMEIAWSSLEGILSEAGAQGMLKAEVSGVLVGDGRDWDEYRLLRFPSESVFEKIRAKFESSDHAVHYAAAVEDEYRLRLRDQIDLTANPPRPK